jgi:cellulose synthase/poly-beta-1,6-N-acetylglucosamine synthase-like glycosyltransferase
MFELSAMMIWVFWAAAFCLAYTFFGYPLLVALLGLVYDRRHRAADHLPSVSFIIAAHNEEKIIRRKIENSLELQYPRDKLEILVASDGSQDATHEIVRSFAAQGVRLLHSPERLGKHHVQMLARDSTGGEILVFTDSSVLLEPGALRQIVSNFADPSVGSVSSEDVVTTQSSKGRFGEGKYIELEMWLRRFESRIGSLVGLSGCFFAARRSVCEVWHPAQSSDFFVALHSVRQGMRAVVDPGARAYYGVVSTQRSELQRKVRTIVHGLDVFFSHLELLNPFRYPLFSWQLISHKLFRWLLPVFLLLLFISNIAIVGHGLFYQLTLVAQCALYALGALALFGGRANLSRPVKMAGFFVLGSMATLLAWSKFCMGEKFA